MLSKDKLIKNLTRKSEKHKFMIFLFSIILSFIILGVLTDNLFPFFFFAIVYLMVVYINKDTYNSLRVPKKQEIAFGIFIIVLSFLLSPIKQIYFPKTDFFGAFNFVVFLFGLTFIFYPIKEFKKIFSPLAILGVLILINLFSAYYENKTQYVDWYASILGNTLNFIGVPTTVHDGSGLSIKGLYGTNNFRIIWGCVFTGALFYGTIGSALLIGIKTSLQRKVICIVFGVLGAFIVNFFRLVILLSIVYYYPYSVYKVWHENLGQIMFITFVGFYWWFSFKYILKEEKKEKMTKISIEENVLNGRV